MKISIVTPWHDCSELCPIYERSNAGAEVIIIDNASIEHHAQAIKRMVSRIGGFYIRNERNVSFSAANNQGSIHATGDVIIFMNNDIEASPGWVERAAVDVKPGALYGPSLKNRMIAGQSLDYLEGYCIAATRDTWESLNWWDAEAYPGPYWEDNDLCLRAQRMGLKLIETTWNIWHRGNYTSEATPGAYKSSPVNYETLVRRVMAG